MARSLLSVLAQANRAAARESQRQHRASVRAQAAAVREAERAHKAEERAIVQAARADTAKRKRLEKEAKAAHLVAMNAVVEQKNAELAAVYEEIDGLLASTLNIDDYVDLETLRRSSDDPPFDGGELEAPIPSPSKKPQPAEPVLSLPQPKGIFGRKKKHERAVEAANLEHEKARADWSRDVAELQLDYQQQLEEHVQAENTRKSKLEDARTRFLNEIHEHNKELDELIANLGYGTIDAVQEYISIVVTRSIYPDHFPVDHKFEFDPQNAELKFRVSIPPPAEVPTIKEYKYKKASDEIVASKLSQKAAKDRYSAAVHQVAIRSFHEIFEADRRGIIQSVSLEVGTTVHDPATGIVGFVPFIAGAVGREKFLEFDLSKVNPAETLKFIGAAISKNPLGLVAIQTRGIRSS